MILCLPLPAKSRPSATGTPLVVRDRLVERMRRAANVKLILVQAPAGFGKTTLLRHFCDLLAADGRATAWLTLDAKDNDLDRFMNGLCRAFTRINRTSDRPVACAGNAFEPARAIVSTPQPFVLVLDECERLHNPAALSVIQQAIEMLGPRQQIVIGSREQPMLNVGRLRACRQLLEIDAAQLRFSLEETTRFLCEQRRLKLDRHDVERLQRITDGWPAALWLASLEIENSDDPQRVIRTFSGANTALASYLAEDVLCRWPKHLQDFILQTSVLKKFCAGGCDAVTGRNDSAKLLGEIERSNMFMTALDEQRIWFGYHPLFAGFLRAQLERRYPGLAASLHHRAALWHAGQKRPIPAIDHAVASGDTALALQLLAGNAEKLFLRGRVRLLAHWFDTLDKPALAAHPKLISVYAWSLIHLNRSAEALTLPETVTREGGASPVPHPTYLVLQTFSLVMLDRIEQTAPMWDDPHILDSAAPEPFLRSMLMIGCAYYYATIGRYQEARLLLDQATRTHSVVGPLFGIAVAGYVHAMLDLLQGRLRAAGARLRALTGEESQMRPRDAETGFASLYLAEVLYETDMLDEAKRLLKLYLPLVKDAGIPDQLIASHVIHARILRAEGNANDALQTLLDLEQLGMQRGLPRVIDIARLEQARGAILDGDIESAKAMLALVGNAPAWQRRGLQMIANDIETPALGAVRLQVHCGHAAVTLHFLKEHLQEAYGRGRLRYALRVKTLYALALHQAGQRNPAMRTLHETMRDARAEGFVRIFKDEGPALLALMRDMLEGMKDASGTESSALRSFAEHILQQPENGMPPAPNHAPAHSSVIAHSAGSNELTGRELDVLALLAQGHGNQVIAEKLFVSVTTVKTHLRNINLKLGAHNRTEAISIARRLHIIS